MFISWKDVDTEKLWSYHKQNKTEQSRQHIMAWNNEIHIPYRDLKNLSMIWLLPFIPNSFLNYLYWLSPHKTQSFLFVCFFRNMSISFEPQRYFTCLSLFGKLFSWTFTGFIFFLLYSSLQWDSDWSNLALKMHMSYCQSFVSQCNVVRSAARAGPALQF